MAVNAIGGTPVTIIFTLIISFLGFFAAVTCVALYYYKRGSRHLQHLEQIQRAVQGRETTALDGTRWSERPVIWEVWADKYPRPDSKWEDLLPLSLAYHHDQPSTHMSSRQSPVLPAPQNRDTGWRSLGEATNVQPRPRDSNDGSQSNLATTDCNLSVFVAMPAPRKRLTAEFGGEFAIGTTEVAYRHPERTNS